MAEAWTVKTKKQAEVFNKFVMEQVEAGREYTYTIQKASRTLRQNATLHLLFRRMATDLNDAGAPDIPHPFNPVFRMKWTEDKVKELLFKPYLWHLSKEWGKQTENSSDCTTEQLSEVMQALVDGVNQAVGVYTPIPTNERY
ncbi:MAG: hypothetical protein EB168_12005 [Euryarchaeota archaeon]|nr:hypothetical protein [Euryarchaeota archaeon]